MGNTLRTAFIMSAMTVLLVLLGGALGGTIGAGIALLFAAGTNLYSYFMGDKAVLARYGAHEVGPNDGSRTYEAVAKLIGPAGVPMPRVFEVPDRSPNAFATGRSPAKASVAATQGLLGVLDDDELAGVMAHELAHVKNRDILTGTIAATLAGAITMIAQMGRYSAMGSAMGGRRSRGNPLIMVAAAIGAPIAAMFLRSAVSRTREFDADDDGAAISGRPEALASALEKIQAVAQGVPLQRATEGHAHLFILNPFFGGGFAKLFSTHPPTEERVARLRARARG